MEQQDAQELLRLQQDTCRRLDLPDVDPDEMVAIAISTLGAMPIYGTRISLPETRNISWFFHCGGHSGTIDFYKPVHTEHLSDVLPSVMKYLRLPHGSKFIIDDNGFEDVWLMR
jgi:hypothetical protein